MSLSRCRRRCCRLWCSSCCFPCSPTKLAVVVGLYATLASWARNAKLAIQAIHAFTDVIWSRGGTTLYLLLRDAVNFADSADLLAVPVRPGAHEVRVVRTAQYTAERLTELPPLLLEPGTVPVDAPSIIIDTGTRYQTFMGFGGSFTESAAEVFYMGSLASQQQIMEAYFREDVGLGYTMGRVHMNACDFSRGHWSCLERPGDVDLGSFSIERYEESMLPLLRRAAATLGRNLTLLASPWSPPAWMKDNGRMVFGGKLLPEHRETWARFYVRFAQEFAAAGVPLWGFSVQNEPDAVTPWENCGYSAEEERDFVRDHLGPTLEASGLDLKLLVWDHNRNDMFLRAQTIYSDPAAARFVWGVGYHWYGDPRFEIWPDRAGQRGWDNVQLVHELRPEKHIIMTEACQEFGPRIGNWALGERYAEALIKDLNHWLEGWVDWNLVLDHTGGPNHVHNLVSAPVILDTDRDRVLFLSSYYYIGHFSRYIRPGAQRVAVASNRDNLEVTAFINVDKTIALVVLNQSPWPSDFWIRFGGRSLHTEAPPHSITTFTFLADDGS